MEVDGLVFRRKRGATPMISSRGQRARISDVEALHNSSAPKDLPKPEVEAAPSRSPTRNIQAATETEESMQEEPASDSHQERQNAHEETLRPPSEVSAATVAGAILQKLPETDSEADRLLAVCAGIPKASHSDKTCYA